MSHNKYVKIPIKGMHCRSCELLIEENLKGVAHVKSVEVNYKNGEAIICHGGQRPNHESLTQAIVSAGYEIGQDGKIPFLATDKKEYIDLGIAFLALVSIFLVLKGLGVLNINLGSLDKPSWGLIILVGVVAGLSTCMALVGGLLLGLSAKFVEAHPNSTASQKFRPHLFFMAGRVLSYAFLGGLLGMLGTVFKFSALTNSILTVLVGVVMLVMGLQLINIFPRLNRFKLTLPKSLANALGFSKRSKEYSHKNAMIMGAFTFFLPCGFTQAMQIYAVSTGNFWSGAMIMGLFALGTAPGLLSIGGLTSVVKGKFKERFFKAAGLAVLFFSLFNFHNAYTLASLSIGSIGNSVAKTEVINDPNVVMENGFQVVHMSEISEGYSPNKFSIRKGVPVKWIIDAKAPYSCASSLMVPQLNINKSLVSGENIIEFTPTQVGKLPFSCSMGMYTGSFNVYDGGDLTPNNPNQEATTTNSVSSSACSISSSASCGGPEITPNSTATKATVVSDVQLIKATYTVADDIQPNNFTVKVGQPVRFEILAKEDGEGCMGSIQIQNLYNKITYFRAGETIVMEFTPQKTGRYLITCAMNVPHGTLTVE